LSQVKLWQGSVFELLMERMRLEVCSHVRLA
jgi:hypothetical protein